MSDFDILGVDINASEQEIKIAYKRLAKQYHPDLNKTPEAQGRFIEINNAYYKIIHQLTETPPIFQSSGIPSINDLIKEMFSEKNSEKIKERRRKEREKGKSVKEILKNLARDISQYASEMLDPLFVDKGRYKETIYDWETAFFFFIIDLILNLFCIHYNHANTHKP